MIISPTPTARLDEIPVRDIRELPMGWDIVTAPCEESRELTMALHQIVQAFGSTVPAAIVRDGNTLAIWKPDPSPVKFWPDNINTTNQTP